MKYQMETLIAATECMTDISKMLHLSEKGRLPHEQTDCVSDPIGGSVEKNDEYEPGIYSNAASDIEQVLEKMAERACLLRNSKAIERKSLTRQHKTFHTEMCIPVYMFG